MQHPHYDQLIQHHPSVSSLGVMNSILVIAEIVDNVQDRLPLNSTLQDDLFPIPEEGCERTQLNLETEFEKMET